MSELLEHRDVDDGLELGVQRRLSWDLGEALCCGYWHAAANSVVLASLNGRRGAHEKLAAGCAVGRHTAKKQERERTSKSARDVHYDERKADRPLYSWTSQGTSLAFV